MSEVLHLHLERVSYAPGEAVRGVVTVGLGQDCRTLSVSCDYCEETRDYNEVSATCGSVELHQGSLQAGQSFPFAFTLPPDAPPAFRARHGKLFWRVDAKADRGGRDPHARLLIDVIPPDAGGAAEPVASFEAAAAVAATPVPSAAPSPADTPAGWYPDPSGQAPQRYWDGAAWTGHTAQGSA